MIPVFRTASPRALLAECPDLRSTMRLHRALTNAGLAGVGELVPAARTVLVRFDPHRTSAERLRARIADLDLTEAEAEAPREVTVDVRYDGEDLAEVASLLDVTADELIRRHVQARWQVAFSGFAPGFGYLACDDPLFRVPRRSSPRTRVPAGAVALADEFTGVYPRSTPGGWQLIGRTEARLWDLDRTPPALLVPGTAVRFRRAAPEAITAAAPTAPAASEDTAVPLPRSGTAPLAADSSPQKATGASEGTAPDAPEEAAFPAPEGAAASASAPSRTSATVEVLRPGLQLLVQDLGREGSAALGVAAAGVADRTAFAQANRAVGNVLGAAVLESFGGSARLRFTGSTVAAVTGASGAFTLTAANGGVHSPAPGAPFAVESGDVLDLGPVREGMRRVVAVRGGVAAAPVLGSVSADTLAHLGPEPLAAGDVLALGAPHTAPHPVDPVPAPPRSFTMPPASADGSPTTRTGLPSPGDAVVLTVVLGPREDWFTAEGLATLLSQEWTVTPDSDRVGMRLHGPVPLERARTGELPSEAAVTGALQVPPDGQPVLFGPDHPLTGGYPVIAAVTDTDLAAQLPPGARVRFAVSESESRTPFEES